MAEIDSGKIENDNLVLKKDDDSVVAIDISSIVDDDSVIQNQVDTNTADIELIKDSVSNFGTDCVTVGGNEIKKVINNTECICVSRGPKQLEIEEKNKIETQGHYIVRPATRSVSIDFNIPDHVTDSLFTCVDDVRESILDEVKDREVTFLNKADYINCESGQIQRLSAVEGWGIHNDDLRSTVLNYNFSNAKIEGNRVIGYKKYSIDDPAAVDDPTLVGQYIYDITGSGTYIDSVYPDGDEPRDGEMRGYVYPITEGGSAIRKGDLIPVYGTSATLQEIYDKLIEIEGSTAGYTSDVKLFADEVSSFASKADATYASSQLIFDETGRLEDDIRDVAETAGLNLDQSITDLSNQLGLDINEVSTKIDSVEATSAGKFKFWNSSHPSWNGSSSMPPSGDEVLGVLKFSDTETGRHDSCSQTTWQWWGSNYGWKRMDMGAEIAAGAIRDELYGTIATASSFNTDSNGRITGWGYIDSTINGHGSRTSVSCFDIKADNFIISNSIGTHRPFCIKSDGNIYFNGTVNFSSLTDAPSHCSDYCRSGPTYSAVDGSTFYDKSNCNSYTRQNSSWKKTTDSETVTVDNFDTKITEIDGNTITTGKIVSSDGKTAFDLTNGYMCVRDSEGTLRVKMGKL